MSTLTETRMNTVTDFKEAELHNAQIAERYKRLQNAESMQFSDTVAVAPAPTVERTVEEPQITHYTREKIDSPVFTTEKFERAETVIAPTQTQAPAAVQTTAVAEQYSLSHMAKMVMAAFAAVVVLMLTLICVNTQIINRQSVRIRNLEEKREELVEKSEEIQARIELAQSEETIREYAISQGMIAGE